MTTFNDINKQLLELNNEYYNDINTVNFVKPCNQGLETQKILHASKNDNNRIDINLKLNELKCATPIVSSNPNFLEFPQQSNSLYNIHNSNNQNNIYNQNQYKNNYNQQTQPNYMNQQHNNVMNENQINNRMNNLDINMAKMKLNNVNNMNDIQLEISNGGYNKIEDKKIDYRQNINNKIDNFIFDNPNIIEYNTNTLINNIHKKDTRMVIQDSNKDYYRQEANLRMSQYSPLSKSSYIPIEMANMTVNDFYSSSLNDNKNIINQRIDNYAPLAKNIQYKSNIPN